MGLNTPTENQIKNASKIGKKYGGANAREILQYGLDNKFIKEWKSTMEIQRQLNISHSHISECCKGKYKTVGGYV